MRASSKPPTSYLLFSSSNGVSRRSVFTEINLMWVLSTEYKSLVQVLLCICHFSAQKILDYQNFTLLLLRNLYPCTWGFPVVSTLPDAHVVGLRSSTKRGGVGFGSSEVALPRDVRLPDRSVSEQGVLLLFQGFQELILALQHWLLRLFQIFAWKTVGSSWWERRSGVRFGGSGTGLPPNCYCPHSCVRGREVSRCFQRCPSQMLVPKHGSRPMGRKFPRTMVGFTRSAKRGRVGFWSHGAALPPIILQRRGSTLHLAEEGVLLCNLRRRGCYSVSDIQPRKSRKTCRLRRTPERLKVVDCYVRLPHICCPGVIRRREFIGTPPLLTCLVQNPDIRTRRLNLIVQ